MSYLLDVNVLMALSWPTHLSHAKAQSWFLEFAKDGWVTSSVTESGFIRLSSNPLIVSEVVTPNACASLLESLKTLGNHSFVTDSVELALELAGSEVLFRGSRQVSDAHLALIAKSNKLTFVTLDSGAAELAQELGSQSLLIQTW